MSTPVLDQMPSVFSAVFEAIKDSKNPTVEANHPMASTNVLRVKIPSGVSTVQVSTNYAGRYQVVHQTTKNGVAVNNRVWFESGGGGVFQVRAVDDTSTLYVQTDSPMVNDTDTWGVTVSTIPRTPLGAL